MTEDPWTTYSDAEKREAVAKALQTWPPRTWPPQIIPERINADLMLRLIEEARKRPRTGTIGIRIELGADRRWRTQFWDLSHDKLLGEAFAFMDDLPDAVAHAFVLAFGKEESK